MDPSDRPEPPDPVPPGKAGDEPPDEKGLVEEHLPRRARYRAGRIAWLILGSFVALIALGIGGGLVYLGRHSQQVAGELTRVLNQALAQHSDLVLEVRDLEGNPFQQVRLIRPRLRLRGSGQPPLLEAPSMTVA